MLVEMRTLNTQPAAMTSRIQVGQQVSLKGEPGVVRFVGETQFADGVWVGLELARSIGKNKGVVNGVRYFELDKKYDNYGIFVRPNLLEMMSASTGTGSTPKIARPNTSMSTMAALGGNSLVLPKPGSSRSGVHKRAVSSIISRLPSQPVVSPTTSRKPSGSGPIASPTTSMKPSSPISRSPTPSKSVSSEDQELRLRKIVQILQDKVKTLTEKVAALQEQGQLHDKTKTALEAKLVELEEILEHKTVDNEMLEEQQLTLQASLEELQAKYELATSNSTGDPQYVAGLELKIDRLSTALVNLKQSSSEEEQSLRNRVEELTERLQTLEQRERDLEITLEKLRQTESIVADLKEQLDSALTSDELVQNLTEKNFELTEKVKQLQETVLELEQLQQLDEEVQRNHLEMENELKADLLVWQAKVEENETLVKELKRKNEYFELTLAEYKKGMALERSVIVVEPSSDDGKTRTDALGKEVGILRDKLYALTTENEMKESDIVNLSLLLLELQLVLVSDPLKKAVEVLELQFRFNSIAKKYQILIVSLSNSCKTEEGKRNLANIYKGVKAFSRRHCVLQFCGQMLQFNCPKDLPQLVTLELHWRSQLSVDTDLVKDLDYYSIGTISETRDSGLNELVLAQNWETHHHFTKYQLLLKLNTVNSQIVECDLWLFGVFLDEIMVSHATEEVQLVVSPLFKKYYSCLSRLKTAVDDLIELLNGNSLYEVRKGVDILDEQFLSLGSAYQTGSQVAAMLQRELNQIPAVLCEDIVEELSHLRSHFLDDDMVKLEGLVASISSTFKNAFSEEPVAESESFLKRSLTVVSDSDKNQTAESPELESIKEEIVEMSKMLKEKEERLQELNLKIITLNKRILESDAMHSKYEAQLKKIRSLTEKNNELLQELETLKTENELHVAEVTKLKSESRRFEGDFGNLYEEKEQADKSLLIGEIHSLRTTLKFQVLEKFSSYLSGQDRELGDDSWLCEQLFSLAKTDNSFSQIRAAYKNLMELTNKSTIIPISSENPNKLVSGHYVTRMKDAYNGYLRMRDAFRETGVDAKREVGE